MPDTIEGYVLGQTVTMRVGDKVGLLAAADIFQTFIGTDVEIVRICSDDTIAVRSYNGYEFLVNRVHVAPALPKKRGRPHVKREPGEKIIATSITLTESDIEYLNSINPKNLSAAIRKLIEAHQLVVIDEASMSKNDLRSVPSFSTPAPNDPINL